MAATVTQICVIAVTFRAQVFCSPQPPLLHQVPIVLCRALFKTENMPRMVSTGCQTAARQILADLEMDRERLCFSGPMTSPR